MKEEKHSQKNVHSSLRLAPILVLHAQIMRFDVI